MRISGAQEFVPGTKTMIRGVNRSNYPAMPVSQWKLTICQGQAATGRNISNSAIQLVSNWVAQDHPHMQANELRGHGSDCTIPCARGGIKKKL